MLEAIRMYFLSSLIITMTAIYLQSDILNKKMHFNFINCFFIISLILLSIINYMFVDSFIRFFSTTILVSIFLSLVLKEKFFTTFVSSFIQQLLFFVSEFIYMIIFSMFSINMLNLSNNNIYFLIIINLLIPITAIGIYEMKFSKEIIKKIILMVGNLNNKNLYLILLVFIITLNFLLTSNYITEKNISIIVVNVFFIIIYSIILFVFILEKNKNVIYLKENKILLSNLNEYEKMLDYQRVNNHENKNQLLVIKSMVERNDKKTIEYINEIIKEKREDNELMYTKAKRIPTGGLQGLVYQKMLVMQENYINVVLDVSSNVRKIDFSKLSSKMNYDICRIMGIILDNAIEETIKFNRKEREIVISMYIDELFVIEVSNRIKDNIELDKIYDKGYTSKEKGHGYGLSLLKKIIDENTNITNELKIINDIFTQIIKIKM